MPFPAWALIASMMGSGLMQGLMTPDPKERKPFTGDLSPDNTLRGAMSKGQDLWDAVTTRMSRPIDFSGAVAQTPGSMRIPGMGTFGFTGRDPALGNPTMLRRPGLVLPKQSRTPGLPTRRVNPAEARRRRQESE